MGIDNFRFTTYTSGFADILPVLDEMLLPDKSVKGTLKKSINYILVYFYKWAGALNIETSIGVHC